MGDKAQALLQATTLAEALKEQGVDLNALLAGGGNQPLAAPVGQTIGNFDLTLAGVWRPLRDWDALNKVLGVQRAEVLDPMVKEIMSGVVTSDNLIEMSKTIYLLMAYDGFNPDTIAAILWSKRGVGISREEFEREILTLIIVFIRRGSKMSKILLKSTENGKRLFNALKLKYSIVDTGRGNDSVTLPRISATFPVFTLKVIMAVGDGYQSVGEFGQLPKCFAFTGAISLMPAGSLFIQHYLKWALSQNNVINSNKKDKQPQKVVDFARIAFDSGVVPKIARGPLMALIQKGVDEDLAFAAAVQGANIANLGNVFELNVPDIRNDASFSGLSIDWAAFGFA